MLIDTEEISESDAEAIFASLGKLALSASQAELRAAQGLYRVLTDKPGDEAGAAVIMQNFRSFDALYRLLKVSLHCDTPLGEVIATARSAAKDLDSDGDPSIVGTLAGVAASVANNYLDNYVTHHPTATAVGYLDKVKALYDKRNECIHALGLAVQGGVPHLYKVRDGARAKVNPRQLVEPCEILEAYDGMSTADAIQAVAIELTYSSLALVILPTTMQWFRRRGTPFDLAPLVDHYAKLALAPFDEARDTLAEAVALLEAVKKRPT